MPLRPAPADRPDAPDCASATAQTTAVDTWIEMIRDTFVALDITPADPTRFSGSVYTRQLAHLMAADVAATSQTFERTPRLTARRPCDLLQIGMPVAGEGLLSQDGRTCALRPGDFALYETSRPFTWNLSPDWKLCVYTWPRGSIPLAESGSQALTATAVRADSALGRLLSPVLSNLLDPGCEVSSAGAIRLADEIAELAITAALEEVEPEDPDGQARQLYTAVLHHINAHLDDPSLSPLQIANTFYISTRTLHRVFARFDTTVATAIRTRRLESCRQALLSPRNAHRSLTDIAARHGFTNLAVFSRAFTSTYGTTPSRYRELGR
ncbi:MULTISPECIES: helix-turn-helix domain-containing protein [Streptomyces]|uniref:Helix-turn-helix domain-containing protein n=1 Tax=Streptomyces sp. 900129855 TaxID=3155129 RepID=A0ABV2ZP68_9ACTN